MCTYRMSMQRVEVKALKDAENYSLIIWELIFHFHQVPLSTIINPTSVFHWKLRVKRVVIAGNAMISTKLKWNGLGESKYNLWSKIDQTAETLQVLRRRYHGFQADRCMLELCLLKFDYLRLAISTRTGTQTSLWFLCECAGQVLVGNPVHLSQQLCIYSVETRLEDNRTR